MSDSKLQDELQRQIERFEKVSLHRRVTTQDPQNIIDSLGGKLKVMPGYSVDSACYYIFLLWLAKHEAEQ
jgi:hypothetical protein